MAVPQSLCPVCASPSRTELPVYCDWNATRWQLVRCRVCGHRYTDSAPTDAEIGQMYADDYFDEGGAWVCGFWKGSYVRNEKKLRREAKEALAQLPRKQGTLLEIGSAGGFFLDEARKAGFNVRGIELNEHMAAWGRSTLGLEISSGMFEAMELPACSFDVIVAQDVLEHVRNPRAFVARVGSLLTPGGIFFVRGPLEQSWREAFYLGVRRLLRRSSLVKHEPPYHLQGFVRQSFEKIVEAAGMRLTLFHASSSRAPNDFSSLKTSVATLLEAGAYAADRVTSRGDFMIACAVRDSDRPSPTLSTIVTGDAAPPEDLSSAR